MDLELSGQCALVTGASRGIGRSILHALAGAGATVLGTATTEKGAADIGAALAAAGHAGRGAVLDVSQPASVEALLADVEAKEGAVTVLPPASSCRRGRKHTLGISYWLGSDESGDGVSGFLDFRLSRLVAELGGIEYAVLEVIIEKPCGHALDGLG